MGGDRSAMMMGQGGQQGSGDAFLTEINWQVSGLQGLGYSTHLGGAGLDYGYGLEIGEYKDFRRIMHMGGTCGFSTTIQRFPDERLTVIILTNRRGANIKPVGEKIAILFLEIISASNLIYFC